MKLSIIFTLVGISISGILFNSCKHEPILPPGTSIVHFNPDIQTIIGSKCTYKCHNGGEEPPLYGYSDLHNYVTDYKPLESTLYKVITAHSSIQNLMPPKPDQPLNKSQIDIISIWILQGAPNN
jgi:hypothetical protein